MWRNRHMPWSLGVVIPAHNEEDRIVACVRSVRAAIDTCRPDKAWIVVVSDGCTDQTTRYAESILKQAGQVIECRAGSAGAARRIGASALLKSLAVPDLSRLWLANTDADTAVPPDWLSKQLRLADEGACAVAGIVSVDSFEGHGPNAATNFARSYVIHGDGTHPHVHGANIGLRADVYVDAGGWSDIAVGEDHHLWQRVLQRGWKVCSSASSVVTTSGRLHGRARGGFADTLRETLIVAEGPMLEGHAP